MTQNTNEQDLAAQLTLMREVLEEQYDGELTFLPAQYDGAILGVLERINMPPTVAYASTIVAALPSDHASLLAHTVTAAGAPVALISLDALRRQASPDRALRDLMADTIDNELLFIDPDAMDSAIMGVARLEGDGFSVVYNRQKLVEQFAADGMDEDDADEWVSFNIEGAYVGSRTPFIMAPLPLI